MEACRTHGIAEPTFVDEAGGVTVTFRAEIVTEGTSVAAAAVAEPGLSDRQHAILRVLAQKSAMPVREISAALEGAPSDRRLREELLHLKQLGLVRLSGRGRGSSWSRKRDAE